MKNVAGYDVSRLLAGSLGTLGLIAEASLKVLPRPPAEATLRLRDDRGARARGAQPLGRAAAAGIGARAWHDGELCVRLSGAERRACAPPRARIGGEAVPEAQAAAFWAGVREQTDAFFAGAEPLWRLAVPPATPPLRLPGRQLIEWGGGLRWLKSDAEPQRDARGGAARQGPCDAVPRRAAQRRGVLAARAGRRCACTAA